MAKLEKGNATKGQLIVLIILLTISLQAILRAVAPYSAFDLFVFCLGIGAIIVVVIRRKPEQPIKKKPSVRSYKDLE